MKTEMVACDNPECRSITDDMYSWLQAEITVVGCGPGPFTVDACSPECLAPAWPAVCQRAEHEEYARTEAWASLVEEMTLHFACNVCGAQEGMGCVSRKTNKPAQRPHASRLDDGRRLAMETTS